MLTRSGRGPTTFLPTCFGTAIEKSYIHHWLFSNGRYMYAHCLVNMAFSHTAQESNIFHSSPLRGKPLANISVLGALMRNCKHNALTIRSPSEAVEWLFDVNRTISAAVGCFSSGIILLDQCTNCTLESTSGTHCHQCFGSLGAFLRNSCDAGEYTSSWGRHLKSWNTDNSVCARCCTNVHGSNKMILHHVHVSNIPWALKQVSIK